MTFLKVYLYNYNSDNSLMTLVPYNYLGLPIVNTVHHTAYQKLFPSSGELEKLRVRFPKFCFVGVVKVVINI